MSFQLPPSSILAAPLGAMDLVVLDTETTGLDVRKDRVIEIAAVWVRAGQVREDEVFSSLINPGVDIAQDSTLIHGISSEDVADAPKFPEVMEQFAAWVGPSVIGGFMTGFDLAILKAEHERHEMKWTQPLALDVRTLAKLCAPELPDESLETLAAWLKIEISGRHRALPDAISAAQMFVRLLPRLKERGIITLGQAMKAAQELRAQAISAAQEGMAAMMPEPPKALGPQRAIDSYPFRNRVRDVMSAEVATIESTATLNEVEKFFADPLEWSKAHGGASEVSR
jgi:DNA polymerase-3 subunit epsilon/CBS domain-containing protein